MAIGKNGQLGALCLPGAALARTAHTAGNDSGALCCALLSAEARVSVVTRQTQENPHPEGSAVGWLGGWLPPPFMT